MPCPRRAAPSSFATATWAAAATCARRCSASTTAWCRNASLILGVAGASGDARLVLMSGVAGLAAGAFAMAAGEYVSVRSQRELFEYQIALERDELKQYPEAEAQELALIYAAKGLPQKEATKLAKQIVADPEHALDTLAREELGLDPAELGSPAGAAASLVPRVRRRRGASARPVPVHCRARARCRPAWPSPASRCSRSARRCRSSPAAARGTRARGCWRWARSRAASPTVSAASSVSRSAEGGDRRGVRARDRPHGRARRAATRAARAPPTIVLKAGRERSLAQRHPWIFSGAIERVDGAPQSGDTVAVVAADGDVARARRVFAGLADPRARLVVRRGRHDRRRVLRARDRPVPRRRGRRCSTRGTAARASSTASRTACPA